MPPGLVVVRATTQEAAVRTPGHSPAPASRAANVTRIAVGLVWIAGAVFNLLVTLRMAAPYRWLEDSPIPAWRWLFREVVSPRARLWTGLLLLCELAIGALTLGGGMRARLGLLSGSAFSAFLFSLGTPYTLMMGPYAALLGWLSGKEFRSVLPRR
jgi:hypothetical protein